MTRRGGVNFTTTTMKSVLTVQNKNLARTPIVPQGERLEIFLVFFRVIM